VAASSATYQDSVGEDPAAPDITTIVVSNDDSANLSFQIAIPNRPQYSYDLAILMSVDSDANPATGDPQNLGADHVIQVVQGQIGLFRWNGADYFSAPSTVSYTWSSGLTIRLNAADFNNTRRLTFGVLAVSGVAFDSTGAINCANCHRDLAPAVGLYAYDVRIASQPPPSKPPKPKPPPPRNRTYRDAATLPRRVYFAGPISIKHVRLGEKLYDTMQRLQTEGVIRVPRVVAVACWSAGDWPSVAESIGYDGNPNLLSGFWLRRQPRWVHIAPKECADVQALMTDRQPNGQRAYALSTILHERVHAEGVDIEAETNCYAVQLIYDFARELHFPVAKALRLEALGVRKTRQVAPRGYWNPIKCRDGGDWDLYSEFRNLTY
jgi:hypothetical protein